MDSDSADFTATRLLRAFFNKFDQKEPLGPIGSPAGFVELAGNSGNQSPASAESNLEAWPRPWPSA